jgi:hypothetical protein
LLLKFRLVNGRAKLTRQKITKTMKRQLILLFSALAVLAGVNQATAQGTAFTYQGRLNNGTNPASGSYDMTFSLYNAGTGGSQVGSTLTSLAVGVTNGLFTVTEDFGAVFNGTPYWLEIGVRTNGGGAFTTLTPRQALTPAPYAIFAEGANAAGITGSIPNSALNPDVALLDGTQTFTGVNSFSNNVRIDGHTLFLSSATSGGFVNDGLYYDFLGLPGINNNSGPFLAGFLGGGLGALSPNTVCLSWDYSGDVWVSNNLSAATLTLRGSSASESLSVSGQNVLASGQFLGITGLGGVQPYIGDDGHGNDVQIGSLTSGITAVACYNAADNVYMHLYCSSITIEGGADVAEPFHISKPGWDQEISPGAVVVIDDHNPGQLKLSDRAYDTRVAGVVSGANGIHPGIQMQQQGLLEGGKNVALTGRVYVQADASGGPIKPGDLLTTSSTAGRAMRVGNHSKAQGAILGKAMTGLSEGNGMVLVLVTLQ